MGIGLFKVCQPFARLGCNSFCFACLVFGVLLAFMYNVRVFGQWATLRVPPRSKPTTQHLRPPRCLQHVPGCCGPNGKLTTVCESWGQHSNLVATSSTRTHVPLQRLSRIVDPPKSSIFRPAVADLKRISLFGQSCNTTLRQRMTTSCTFSPAPGWVAGSLGQLRICSCVSVWTKS